MDDLTPRQWLAPFEEDLARGRAALARGDVETALRLWGALAAQGFSGAQYNLGQMYAQGDGVPRDLAEAARWYLAAADQRHPDAAYNLGRMHALGDGVSHDLARAAALFAIAAEQGHAAAQFNLGLAYATGQGVTRNYGEAAYWWIQAADQGYAAAQGNLGALFMNGHGVPRNRVSAHVLFTLALPQLADSAARGSVAALLRTLESAMTADEMNAAHADARAGRWQSA